MQTNIKFSNITEGKGTTSYINGSGWKDYLVCIQSWYTKVVRLYGLLQINLWRGQIIKNDSIVYIPLYIA